MSKRPLRIAVVTNKIPPYRTPIFQRLSETKEFRIRLFTSFPTDQSDPLAQERLDLKHTWSFNVGFRTAHTGVDTVQREQLPIPVTLPIHLLRYAPDVVISGEFGLRSVVALFTSRLLRTPLVLWSEEISASAQGISRLQRTVRAFLFRHADRFLAWGQPAARYLTEQGIPGDRVDTAAQAIDNEAWRAQSAGTPRDAVRARLGVRGKMFLLVGRFVERKGFHKFLEAWRLLPEPLRESNTVILVGDGEENTHLKSFVESERLQSVQFVGWRHGAELIELYASADVFVFPSLVDVWGLVVNEALTCGIPVIGSRYAGAVQELITEPAVGEIIDPLDTSAFAACLARWCVSADPVPREACRMAAATANFDVTEAAIRNTVNAVTERAD